MGTMDMAVNMLKFGACAVLCAGLMSLPGAGVGAVSGAVSSAAEDDSLWIADLAVFEKELPERHKNLFFELTPEEFHEAVDRLRSDIPGLEPYERVVSLMKIVASVGDSHTMLSAQYSGLFRKLPVVTEWFSDGLWVISTVSEYEALLGRRLTRVGRTPVGELSEAVKEVIPHENTPQLLNRMPDYIAIPEVLAALGIAESPDSVAFHAESSGEVKVRAESALSPFKWVSVRDGLECEPPLYLRSPDSYYWYSIPNGSRTLYVHYRQCAETSERPFAEFVEEALALVDEGKADRLVFDMRMNGGGNSMVARPIIDGIKRRKSINTRGRLFVIVGRETYSSAILNALEFKNETAATFYGEPTGGKPNHYGEVKFFPLPNSRLFITYSTKYFNRSGEDTPSFVPDVVIRTSFEDLRSCRDPVLEKILSGDGAAPASAE